MNTPKHKLSNQALGAVMMALQESLLNELDIVPILQSFELVEGEAREACALAPTPQYRHTLGGHAQKWDDGWVLGTIKVKLTNLPDWIDEKDQIDSQDKTINLIHVHQDQVTKLPVGAQRIGTNRHCKNAAFIVGDTVFAVQGHPEFDAPYAHALVGLLEDRAGKSRVKAARRSLSIPHNGQRVAKWILAFFNRHKPARREHALVKCSTTCQTAANENNQNVTRNRP